MVEVPVVIFTKEDKRKIEGHLKAIAEAKKAIIKAKQANIDVSSQEAELARLETNLLALKRTYFPTG